MAAQQRGHATRIITLAHQVEAMARQGKHFKALDHYLKPIGRKRPGRRRDDGIEAVAAMLERRQARRERAESKPKPRKDRR